ncbi:MAG: hypothetical protein IT267_00760 [Saprospiraceae bacterium]|nr:hypothetical protein [Saprospiraceae bacterium]
MKKLLYSLCCILLVSCNSSKNGFGPKGTNLKAMTGTWQQRGKQKFEKWAIVSPTETIGVAYDMTSGSTTINESMKLFKADETWIYQVKTGKDSLPVQFKLIPDKSCKLRFVNEKNDYPNVIKYFIVSDTSMYAEITDMKGINTEKFDFVKYVKK